MIRCCWRVFARCFALPCLALLCFALLQDWLSLTHIHGLQMVCFIFRFDAKATGSPFPMYLSGGITGFPNGVCSPPRSDISHFYATATVAHPVFAIRLNTLYCTPLCIKHPVPYTLYCTPGIVNPVCNALCYTYRIAYPALFVDRGLSLREMS